MTKFYRLLSLILWTLCSQAAAAEDILIYYSNETHLDDAAQENYRVLSSWLNSDTDPFGPKIAGQIANDAETFGKEVTSEIGIIKQFNTTSNILIFTNKLSAQRKAQVFRTSSGTWSDIEFNFPPLAQFILQSNPNGSPKVFEQALALAATTFPPDQHRFSLVTKSHGSKFFIMVPRITISHEDFSREGFLDIVHNRTKIENIPPWMLGMGTTRAEYFNIIRDAGRKFGMSFDLVFTESCKSRVGVSSLGTLPGNVSVLVSPSSDLEYSTIPYEKVFRSGEQPTIFLGRFLMEKFPNDIALAVSKPSPLRRSFPYWVPFLLLILIGSGIQVYRGRNPKSSSSDPSTEQVDLK